MLLSAFDLPFCGPGTAAVQIKLNLGTDKSSWSHSTGLTLLGYIHKPCWLHALKKYLGLNLGLMYLNCICNFHSSELDSFDVLRELGNRNPLVK